MPSVRKRRAEAEADRAARNGGPSAPRPRGPRAATSGAAASRGRDARRAAEQEARRVAAASSAASNDVGRDCAAARAAGGAVAAHALGSADVVAGAGVSLPRFDEEEASIAPGPLQGSPVSAGGSPGRGPHTADAAVPPPAAPSVAVMRYCINFFMDPLRAIVRQESAAAAAANIGAVATEVVNSAVPAFAAAVPAVGVPAVARSPRSDEEVKLATTKVLPNKLIRKVYAEKMCIRMLVLFNLLDASGDVLTPFFPPQAKLESSDPFALKHFEGMCLSVLQGLYLAMHARGNVPDILRGKGRVLSSRMDAVDDAFLIQLRTLFNDGRSAAPPLFYRFIGFFFMHESPKVTIRLVHPAEPVLDVEGAEGSPFIEVETTLVATVDGVVDAIVTPPLPPSAAHGPSGGSFTAVSSLVNYTGALGGAETRA